MNQGGHNPRKTMAYSFVDPTARRTALAPTEEMVAQPLRIPGTVKSLVSELIEKDVEAWRALPVEVRSTLMDMPGACLIVPNEKTGIPNLIVNGVELRCNGTEWVLVTIHNKQ